MNASSGRGPSRETEALVFADNPAALASQLAAFDAAATGPTSNGRPPSGRHARAATLAIALVEPAGIVAFAMLDKPSVCYRGGLAAMVSAEARRRVALRLGE